MVEEQLFEFYKAIPHMISLLVGVVLTYKFLSVSYQKTIQILEDNLRNDIEKISKRLDEIEHKVHSVEVTLNEINTHLRYQLKDFRREVI